MAAWAPGPEPAGMRARAPAPGAPWGERAFTQVTPLTPGAPRRGLQRAWPRLPRRCGQAGQLG